MKRILIIVVTLAALSAGCWYVLRNDSQKEMVAILSRIRASELTKKNSFSPETQSKFYDSLIAAGGGGKDITLLKYNQTSPLLKIREEEQAIEILEDVVKKTAEVAPATSMIARKWLAFSYMRLGEKNNCLTGHSAESCILPIAGRGIHRDRAATVKAKELYLQVLSDNPDDLESRWLLNIVAMTLGEYPDGVPATLLIPGLNADTVKGIEAFTDIAPQLGLDIKNMAGGVIVDDFDNDGFLDIVTTGWGLEEPMHYLRNDGNGSFSDRSAQSGLQELTGGLNCMQADYNNDGFKDILVLRGAWKNQYGKEPNSLIRNNGDGTFTDVTTTSGILSYHPTQAATWSDFNGDGWLDLFIGNETTPGRINETHPCELFMSNRDGTFTEVAAKANCAIVSFVKGVTSGDYDNDGRPDIFISALAGGKILLRNTSDEKQVSFTDVTKEAGLVSNDAKTFPTWFWDYNNDGWLDIFVCGYDYDRSLSIYAAAEKLKINLDDRDKMFLYRNNQDGTFTNVAAESGLDTYVFGMGSNFGDIDNDGFLDMYIGTGNPWLPSVVPNRMFWNRRGKTFEDVTTAARVGHLQKGHAVAFADLDNDGDQDIYTDMGGPYQGDAYPSSLFLNPGQGNNHWIKLVLEGTVANRSAIGSRIKITFHENGVQREIYRDVNSGGSFGASPLRREIGVGKASLIDAIEIQWPGAKTKQVFSNVAVDQMLRIRQNEKQPERIDLRQLNWTPLISQGLILKAVK